MSTLFTPDNLYQGIITLGAVIGGIKVTMNGMHKSQARLEKGQSEMKVIQVEQGERLTRVETTIEFLRPKTE